MAESKQSKSFQRKPVPISAGTGTEVEEMPPAMAQTPPEAPPEPSAEARPEKRRGRPPKPETSANFWNAIQEVPADEWRDKRAYVYIYLREPFCDLKTEGQPGYLLKVHEPIDPDFIMHRWGSGKYYLWAKRRTLGAKTDYTHADLTFEIFNPEFPPKLPRQLWDKDTRNDRWLALLPKEAPPDPPGAKVDEATKWLGVLNDIRRDAKEENGTVETGGQFSEIVDAVTKLIALSRPPETAPAVDPWTAAEKILNMRSDNPMVTILSKQLEALTAQLNAERDARQKLEADTLRSEIAALRDQLKKPDAGGDFLQKLKELKDAKDTVKDALGLGDEAGPARRRSFGEMLMSEFIPRVLDSPAIGAIGSALAQRMMMGPPPPAGMTGAPHPQVQPGQQPKTPAQEFEEFIPMATKAMLGYLSNPENTGDMFADWMYAGWPDQFARLKTLTHPMMPGQQGAPVIIAFYQHSQYWPAITAFEGGETRFKQFVADFCNYQPEGTAKPGEEIPEAEHEDIDGEEETTELDV